MGAVGHLVPEVEELAVEGFREGIPVSETGLFGCGVGMVPLERHGIEAIQRVEGGEDGVVGHLGYPFPWRTRAAFWA